MTILKEKLTDFKEKFEIAQQLVEETKSETLEPYKNHYKAREILQDLEKNLDNVTPNFSDNPDDLLTINSILGYVRKDIGKISMFVEETSLAERYFKKAVELLESDKNHRKIIVCYVDVLNQLGILWSKLDDTEKSKEFLLKSEEAAKEFKEISQCEPLTIFDVFGTEIEEGKGTESLEKTRTLTYFYLAQVFGQLGKLETSAKYCHLTLNRQLELKDYEPIEWALNSATLSQYYFGKNMLKQSRHLLAASCYILGDYSKQLEQKKLTEEQRAVEIENFRHRSADVDLCIAKYSMYILKTSIERLLQEGEESSKESDAVQFKVDETCERFPLDLAAIEGQISDQFVLTYDDAKQVFLEAQSYLNKAKEYYSLENEASQYARIIQDYASLYKNLAFFDDDSANQAKLHKRRADHLEAVQNELNPTFYLNICRELMFELGLAYSDMLDIKCEKLKFEEVQPQVLSKINKLCHKAIEKFQQFIDSYKDKATNQIPDTLDVDDFQAIACAHFNLGRLYYKIITPDKKMQLENTQKSHQNYKTFLGFCEKYKEVAERMKGEKSVTQSMVELLPHKIKKLMDELSQ